MSAEDGAAIQEQDCQRKRDAASKMSVEDKAATNRKKRNKEEEWLREKVHARRSPCWTTSGHRWLYRNTLHSHT